jgi:glutamine amidotransferase
MLAVVDTQASNLASVLGAMQRVGVSAHVTRRAADIDKASAIILPGVGAFEQAMNSLMTNGLVEALRRRVLVDKVPIFGICLGMQLLGDSSEEYGDHPGLGILSGKTVRLQPSSIEFRVPNIGWCDTRPTRRGLLFPNDADVRSFYYLHSYHMVCSNDADRAAAIAYSGHDITVAVERKNIFGVQFHPEKSQDAGLDLLDRVFTQLLAFRQAS